MDRNKPTISTMNESLPASISADAIFSALLPVLFQCFGVILLGYFAGKFKVLSESQVKGLGVYVTKFALPAIFFTVMVTMDFSGVDWLVVLAVSLGKFVMFAVTLLLTLIVSRGKSVGLAGLLAMFTSQSNDVALAYPVLQLLFPDLANYIYLFAPAQLVILNPFSYFALEWHSAREKAAVEAALFLKSSPEPDSLTSNRQRKYPIARQEVLKVIRHVIFNPLFFMTIIGVVFNFILNHRLPFFLNGFFKTLGDSFGATALFYLGFSMVGRVNAINRRGVYILVLILLGKILILPFITRAITVLLLANQQQRSLLEKSSFTFLYAGAPTAPPVFLFASQYGLEPEVIGAGLVIGTFMFGPIMFLFAGMSTMANVDPSFYDSMLQRTAIYLSWISILCCIWTLIILMLKHRSFRIPYQFLLCLIASVLVFCLTVAIGSIWFPRSLNGEFSASWIHYFIFTVFFVTVSAARVWTAIIAISLFLRKISLAHFSSRLQILFYLLGFSGPVAAAFIMMLSAHHSTVLDINPVFHYGKAQQICSVVIVLVCLSATLISTVLLFHCKKEQECDNSFKKSDFLLDFHDNSPPISEQSSPFLDDESQLLLGDQECDPSSSMKTSTPIDYSKPRQDDLEEDLHRYFLLLILLMISMFFGLCICLWRLIRETSGSVFIVVEFLDQAFNFGQGIIIFAVFGIDTELVIQPISRFVSRIKERFLLFSTGLPSSVHLVKVSQNEVESFALCHLKECSAEISRSLTLANACLDRVFSFSDFHNWLLRKGLTESPEASFSLLLALEDAGRVRRLNRVSGKALFAARKSSDNGRNSITLRERTSLFQFLWN